MTNEDNNRQGSVDTEAVPQTFLDGYHLGFSAAKHPFHRPTVEEAWKNLDDIRARGHLPIVEAQ